MKLIKQAVYLPINDEWIENKLTLMSSDGDLVCNLYQNIGYFFTPEQLNEYTQAVIKQALETASEKAYHIAKYESTHPLGGSRIAEVWVSKQSITDTFEETFKKFEV